MLILIEAKSLNPCKSYNLRSYQIIFLQAARDNAVRNAIEWN